jgi:enamine deaminase RidA (YjgF/YER057c/UK114 family)
MKTLIFLIAIVLFQLESNAQSPEENLSKMGIKLYQPGIPIGSYVDAVRVGNLIFLSGKGPRKENGAYVTGKLGRELSLTQGSEAAKLSAINQISVLKYLLGDLMKVKRIVKVTGFVNSENNFIDHPKVINGFSEMMIQIFGEKGQHARTALGVNTLPLNMAVEVEMIVEVE